MGHSGRTQSFQPSPPPASRMAGTAMVTQTKMSRVCGTTSIQPRPRSHGRRRGPSAKAPAADSESYGFSRPSRAATANSNHRLTLPQTACGAPSRAVAPAKAAGDGGSGTRKPGREGRRICRVGCAHRGWSAKRRDRSGPRGGLERESLHPPACRFARMLQIVVNPRH